MSKRRHFGRVLAGAAIAVIGFCGTPAAAQQVDRIVAFGDSYADDGNAFQLLGIDPVTTIIYPTGRFTGGTNYVDTLGTIYSADAARISPSAERSLITTTPLPRCRALPMNG